MKYAQFPDMVIMDLQAAIAAFHEETAKMHEYEWCIDEILGEILRYLAVREVAAMGLRDLATNIQQCFGRDGELLSKAALALAQAVYQQLQEFRMYADDGVLPYRFGRDWQDNYTPILIKIIDEDV